MTSAGWEYYVDDSFKARLARSSAIVAAVWSASGLGVVVAIVLAFVAPSDGWFNWIAVALLVIVAYASPVAFLFRARIRGDLEGRLSAAGVQFSGHPPTRSAKAFDAWIARNALDADSVRSALRQL